MIPLVVLWPAANSGRVPCLFRIIPNVPLVAASDAALVPPDVRLAIQKLVDIELQGLRGSQVLRKKVNIIDKVVGVGVDAVAWIPHSLRRELADQVVVPKYIRVFRLPANGQFHGFTGE